MVFSTLIKSSPTHSIIMYSVFCFLTVRSRALYPSFNFLSMYLRLYDLQQNYYIVREIEPVEFLKTNFNTHFAIFPLPSLARSWSIFVPNVLYCIVLWVQKADCHPNPIGHIAKKLFNYPATLPFSIFCIHVSILALNFVCGVRFVHWFLSSWCSFWNWSLSSDNIFW